VRTSLVALVVLFPACGEDPPVAASRPSFVDDATCAECHAYEAERWRGSHHDLAMQEASETTVLGDFDDARFESEGVATRFFRRDGGFWVETEGPDGASAEFEVAYVFGVDPLQQVLVRFPGGRLQCLTVAWDTAERRWFSLYPGERFAPSDPLHWTGLYQRWNSMCADCHSTELRRGYDVARDAYDTTFAALDVGCQACHGPGSEHVARARQREIGDYDEWRNGLVTTLRRGRPREQLDACAPCHSRRIRLTETNEIGAPFLDGFLPERLNAPLYHADGQIEDEVYEWGSFAQSKMHERGVACGDCHEPHSLELLAPGDDLCLQCHVEMPPTDRFPTLVAKRYDTPEHHHHPPESEGARCVSCHMPTRTYMVLDPRRDHSLRIPRPDLSVQLGTPNACTDCHAEQTAGWAAETVDAWFGKRERPRTFAPVLAAARRGDPRALGDLAALARDADTPAIVRASAVELWQNYPADLGREPLASALRAALADPDGLVRATAAERLDLLPPERRIELAAPLLADPLRAVRVAAARVLAAAERALDPSLRAGFERAAAEYLAVQDAQADMPWSHLNRGVFAADRGDVPGAEAAYRTALRLDPGFLPARFNLANLLNAGHRNTEAEAVLREGLARAPDAAGEGELHFSLGLLLAEENRLDEAAAALTRASELVPDRPRVFTNLGLALRTLGKTTEAESALWRARAKDANDTDALQVLAELALARGDRAQALALAEELARLLPNERWPRDFATRIRAGE
jgi:predicted CXXCH cytochrome family protein